ncbi:MAG: ATP-grasp domain-containing protein, partial [Candidatus Riflebacteria bacterium]|nr:ATP-grasp domain-containing protein [Candidatus Riflebacteria bacterium]
DKAENRHVFSAMLDELEIDQPRWKELSSVKDVFEFSENVGFPLLVRPSYVLSGAAMNIVSNVGELEHFLSLARKVSKQYPVVVSEFIQNAKEIEIDAVGNRGEIVAYAISEHIEFAGVHSGDATIVFPPQKIYFETVRRIKKITKRVAKELNITGPFNMQFLAKDNEVMVIECNLRASRSFPFVSKVLKTNFIEIATKVMLGKNVRKVDKSIFDLDYLGIKAPQFSFSRLHKADPVIGVDMVSTGEVGCIGEGYYETLLKSMISVGYTVPERNILLSTGPIESKVALLDSVKLLKSKGFEIYATHGTHDFLVKNGVDATVLFWPDENREPNTLVYLKEKKIDLVINIPKNLSANELNNDYIIRRNSIDYNIPLITNPQLAKAFIHAICTINLNDISIKSWDEYR